VLSTQFHGHACKLNINWPSIIILSTFTRKYERKYDFRLYFPMSSIVFAYAYYFVTSAAAQSRPVHPETAAWKLIKLAMCLHLLLETTIYVLHLSSVLTSP
jgi:hypothetical protein